MIFELTSCCSTDSDRSHRCCYSATATYRIRLRLSTARRIFRIPILYNKHGDAPKKNVPSRGGFGPHLMDGFFLGRGPPDPYPNDTSTGSNEHSSTVVCDQQTHRGVGPTPRQTHRPHYICNNRPHLVLCVIGANDR